MTSKYKIKTKNKQKKISILNTMGIKIIYKGVKKRLIQQPANTDKNKRNLIGTLIPSSSASNRFFFLPAPIKINQESRIE